MKAATFALISLLASFARSHIITGTIEKKSSLIDFSQMSITLNNGEFKALVDINGNFAIGVPDYAALYKLEV